MTPTASLLLAVTLLAQDAPAQKLQEVPLEDAPPAAAPDGSIEHPFRRVEEAARRDTPEMEIEVERLWSRGAETLTRVGIRNTSELELDEIVLHCTAFAPDESEVGSVERRVVSTPDQPLGPGFSTTLEIPLDATGARVGSVSCNARGY